MRKPVMSYANNKGADQPAHPISTFVVHCLDSIICLVSIASVAEQVGLCLTRSQTTKTGFLVTRLKIISAVPVIRLPHGFYYLSEN